VNGVADFHHDCTPDIAQNVIFQVSGASNPHKTCDYLTGHKFIKMMVNVCCAKNKGITTGKLKDKAEKSGGGNYI
jgi:hypothetical protein